MDMNMSRQWMRKRGASMGKWADFGAAGNVHLAKIMRKRASINVAYSAVVLFTLGAAQQQWPVSDHFDGTHFFNHEPTPRDQLHDFLRKIQPGRDRGSWKTWDDLPTDKP